MITIIHGNNILGTRNQLQLLKSKYSEIITLDGKKSCLTDVLQCLETSTLSGETRLVILENLLSGKIKHSDIIEYFLKNDFENHLILWEDKKTKNKDLGYKRQLVFYKLLADLDQTFNYEVVEAELDFVEGQEGNFVKHSFVISREEIDTLKTVIKEVMQKIRNLEFPRTTNYDFCDYCEFKAHCFSDGLPMSKGQLELFGEAKD